MVIACNKMDIPEAQENYKKIKSVYEPKGIKVFPISAATNNGLDELLLAVADILKDYPEDIVFEEDFTPYVEAKVDNEPFTIVNIGNGYYAVEGIGVEKMMGYTNIDTEKI